MRLDTHARKKICVKIFRRYQKAGKKGKGEILDGYAKTLECSRGYLARLLANRGKTRYAAAGNETVKFTAEEPVKGRRKAPGGAKTGRPEKYRKAFVYRFLNPLLKQYQYIRLKQNRESLAVTGEIS